MVVMCAWSADIALSAVFNGGRFDLGFYAGRLYGLMAASFVLLVLLIESGMLYARLVDLAGVLRRLTSVDPLTGIANRRSFDAALDIEWRRALRERQALSLLMIDVDFFKRFNDTYGHVAGDDCLRAVATTLTHKLRRGGDLVARYGGEEFVALLPNTAAAEAQRVAQALCLAIEERAIPHSESAVARHVTVSIGVGSVQPPAIEHPQPIAATVPLAAATPHPAQTRLVEAADRALYSAKAAGRNRASEVSLDAQTMMVPDANAALRPLRPA
jgi:diguanylate cyclase (GGDEF)-like protein